jgi:putrescine transport system permease protein
VRSTRDNRWQKVTVAIPYIWLLLFFLAPFLIVFQISFSDPLIGLPPFTPTIDEDGNWLATLDNYRFLLTDKLYGLSYLKSVLTAASATVFCLLLGFPMAYAIARSGPRLRNLFLLLIILPFWISFLLRVYAWMGLLNTYGVINNLLLWAGLISEPLQLMYTDFAVYIGLVYSYLPFMILPVYATLERLDNDLVDAAMDLGASPWQAFRDITWPLARPGVIAGCLLVFIPAIGEYVIPYLLGGPESLMIGRVLFDEFFVNRDWPLASAVAIVLLLLLVVPIMFLQRQSADDEATA